jgi:hypothetical protein
MDILHPRRECAPDAFSPHGGGASRGVADPQPLEGRHAPCWRGHEGQPAAWLSCRRSGRWPPVLSCGRNPVPICPNGLQGKSMCNGPQQVPKSRRHWRPAPLRSLVLSSRPPLRESSARRRGALCISAYAFLAAERARLSPRRLWPSSKPLQYPEVSARGEVPLRPERHNPASIASLRRLIARMLARHLVCCHACGATHVY